MLGWNVMASSAVQGLHCKRKLHSFQKAMLCTMRPDEVRVCCGDIGGKDRRQRRKRMAQLLQHSKRCGQDSPGMRRMACSDSKDSRPTDGDGVRLVLASCFADRRLQVAGCKAQKSRRGDLTAVVCPRRLSLLEALFWCGDDGGGGAWGGG